MLLQRYNTIGYMVNRWEQLFQATTKTILKVCWKVRIQRAPSWGEITEKYYNFYSLHLKIYFYFHLFEYY